MKRGFYTPHQIALLRAEILAVYNRAKSELGGNVSWSTIATWIEEAYENLTDQERNSIEAPYRDIKTISFGEHDNFRKFCVGDHKEMKPPEKLIALDIWLTEKDNRWSLLTTEKLWGINDYSKVASCLESFLFENNSECPALNADNLHGEYTGTYYGSGEGNQKLSEISLKIDNSSNPHVAIATVYAKGDQRESTLINRIIDKFALEREDSLSGWIVMSPEDNLVCYLKDTKSGSNHIYYLIAINDTVFDGAKADCLLFLDRQIPSEINEKVMSSDLSDYLADWAKKNECNLLKFIRNN